MKIFIGQAVTGKDFNKLKEESMKIIKILEEKGHEAYCTMCEEDEFQASSKKSIFDHAFELIDNHDIFLAIIRDENRSEGLLIEIGYCMAKGKRIFLVVNKDVKDKTYLPDLIEDVIEIEDMDDLYGKLKELKLK